MAQVEQHLHKKHLKVSNHPIHSGYMSGYGGFPLGTFPSFESSADEAAEENMNPEPPEEPGEAPEKD